MLSRHRVITCVTLLFVNSGCGTLAPLHVPPAAPAATERCVEVGRWYDPQQRQPVAAPEVQRRLAEHDVILLGESHDRIDHHLWQLQAAAALLAEGRPLILAFEMLPRSGQAAIDRWTRGEGSEQEFLEASGYLTNWSMPAELYLPLFRFARANRLPMLGINVDRSLVARVAHGGWAAVEPGAREGVGDPAPAPEAYTRWLRQIWGDHQKEGDDAGVDEAALQRFIEAQLVWDRAFAEAIAAAVRRHPEATVVGIIGSGHLERGFGVPHQLAALGVERVATLLPWDVDRDCTELGPDFATAVFGTEAVVAQAPPKPRLGVLLEPAEGGIRIAGVTPGSLAATAGLIEGDIVRAAAGRALQAVTQLQTIVARQAPGTWLPLRVGRAGSDIEIVVRFPPEP